MGDTLIAVAGTRLGGLLTGLPQSRCSRAARRAARAAFDMRGAADLATLAARREHAVTATDDLVAVAGRVLRQGA